MNELDHIQVECESENMNKTIDKLSDLTTIDYNQWIENELFVPDIENSQKKIIQFHNEFKNKIINNKKKFGEIYHRIGLIYKRKKNYPKMKEYLMKSIDCANTDSMIELGLHFQCVEIDYVLMMKYYLLSIIFGSSKALEDIKKYFKSKTKSNMKKKFILSLQKITKNNICSVINVNLMTYRFLQNLNLLSCEIIKKEIEELKNDPDVKFYIVRKNFSIKHKIIDKCDHCNLEQKNVILTEKNEKLCFDCYSCLKNNCEEKNILNFDLTIVKNYKINILKNIEKNDGEIINYFNDDFINYINFEIKMNGTNIYKLFQLEKEIKDYQNKLKNELEKIKKYSCIEYSNIGDDLVHANEDFEAYKCYMTSVKLGNNDILNKLGLYYRKKNKFDFMKTYFEIGIEKNMSNCMCDLAMYYKSIKKFDLMEKYLLMANETDGNVYSKFNLACYYQNKKINYDTMIEYFTDVINQNIGTLSFYSMNNLGIYYFKIVKDEDMAMKYFELASQNSITNAMNNLAQCYKKKKEFDNMIKYFELAISNNNLICANMLIEYYKSINDNDNVIRIKKILKDKKNEKK